MGVLQRYCKHSSGVKPTFEVMPAGERFNAWK